MKKLKVTLTGLLLLIAPLTNSYIVQKGDTLSEIAQENLLGPIYGWHGSLKKLLRLNAWIKDENLIFPNQYLELGALKEKLIFEKGASYEQDADEIEKGEDSKKQESSSSVSLLQ